MKAIALFILGGIATLGGCQSASFQPPQLLELNQLAQEDAVLSRHFTIDGASYTLTISEASGLTLLSGNNEPIAILPGSFSQADLRNSVSGVDIVALNANTSAVHVVSYFTQEQKFVEQARLDAVDADVEAVCSFNAPHYSGFYTADALGAIAEYAIVADRDGQQVVRVRHFNAAPGVKSCAVAEGASQLYLADEYVGVWSYPTDPESEAVRKLVFHDASFSIAGVTALPSGEAFWVSPDKSGLWQLSANNTFIPFAQPVEPEAVSVSRKDGGLLLSVFDDKTQRVFHTTLPADETPATAEQTMPEYHLQAVAETTPVKRFGDAADDPAIWANKAVPAQSLIIGTDKKAGLNVYNLDGQQIQHLAVGRVNNVDVRYDWAWQGGTVDIAAASNRTTNSIDVFAIAPRSGLVSKIGQIPTSLSDVYGLCLYQHDQEIEVFINATDGMYARYQLTAEQDKVEGILLETFKLPSQPEGCVVNDETHEMFVGEEAAGVWLWDLTKRAETMSKIAEVNGQVHADIEGMGLFNIDGNNYLIVSSQGNNRYAVYDTTAPYTLVGTFSIEIDLLAGIDGVTETDGLEVTALSLGSEFPHGLLVVQDGHNILPSDKQNFKLVDGGALKQIILQMKGR